MVLFPVVLSLLLCGANLYPGVVPPLGTLFLTPTSKELWVLHLKLHYCQSHKLSCGSLFEICSFRGLLSAPDHTLDMHTGVLPSSQLLSSMTHSASFYNSTCISFSLNVSFLRRGNFREQEGPQDLCSAILKSKVCYSPFLTTFDTENVGGFSQA